MKKKLSTHDSKSCDLPRRQEAIEALLGIAWMKGKKDRPNWLLKELSAYK